MYPTQRQHLAAKSTENVTKHSGPPPMSYQYTIQKCVKRLSALFRLIASAT